MITHLKIEDLLPSDFLDLRIFKSISMTRSEFKRLIAYWKCPSSIVEGIHPRLLEILNNTTPPQHGGHIVHKNMYEDELMDIANAAMLFRVDRAQATVATSTDTYACSRCGKEVFNYIDNGFMTYPEQCYDSDVEDYIHYRSYVNDNDEEWRYRDWITKCTRCDVLVCNRCSDYCELCVYVEECCESNDYCDESCGTCRNCKRNNKFKSEPNTFEHEDKFLCRNVICNDDCAGTGKRKCLLHKHN